MVRDPTSKGIAMFMQHHQQRYRKKTSKKLLKNSKVWNKVIQSYPPSFVQVTLLFHLGLYNGEAEKC